MVSLVLAVIACLGIGLSLLGCVTFVVAGAGLALGFVGIVVAVGRRRGFPWLSVAGASVSTLALAVSVVTSIIFLVDRGIGHDTRWKEYTEVSYDPNRVIALSPGELPIMPHFALSSSGQGALYGGYGDDCNVYYLDMNTGEVLAALDSNVSSMSVQCAAFSPDGKRAVSAGGTYPNVTGRDVGQTVHGTNWFLCYWDLSNGKRLALRRGGDDWVRSIAYSPVDDKVVTGGDGGDIWLWDLGTMQVVHKFVGHSSGIKRRCLVWSQDGKALLSGSWDGSIRLWDVDSGKEIAHMDPGYGRVVSLALSLDGKYAMSSYLSGPDQPVILWDIQKQQEVNRFGIPGNPWQTRQSIEVTSTAFSPDGRTALFGTDFGTVIWWDIQEWRQIAMNRLHEEELYFVAFSADGSFSISVGKDDLVHHEVKFWGLPARDTAGVQGHSERQQPNMERTE